MGQVRSAPTTGRARRSARRAIKQTGLQLALERRDRRPPFLLEPYIVFAALLILPIVAVIVTPETVEKLPARPRYRPQRVSMDHGDRTGYATAAALGITSFAINGVYTALAAGFVSGALHLSSHLLAGSVAFSLLASAAVTQAVTTRLFSRTRQIIGLICGGAGLVLLAIGVEQKSMPAIGVGIAVHFAQLSVAMYWFASILLAVIVTVEILAARSRARHGA